MSSLSVGGVIMSLHGIWFYKFLFVFVCLILGCLVNVTLVCAYVDILHN